MLYVFTTFQKCLMGTTMGTETIARCTELRLVEHFEYLTNSLLNHSVNNRRDLVCMCLHGGMPQVLYRVPLLHFTFL